MRILFISDNFPPETNAPATRTYDHCKRWVATGTHVTVLTCFPNFPQGKVYEGYRNKLFQIEVIDGIKVIRIWSFITKNEGIIKRVIDFTSFAFMAFCFGLFQRFDVVIITSPQFFTTLSGFFLSIFKRRPWIFELRDMWPESIVAVGAMKPSRILTFLEKLEHFMYRQTDLIIVVTNAFKANLISRDIPASKIHVITNGVNLAAFQPIEKDNSIVEQLELQNKFVVGYIGTHGMAHNLPFIIENLPLLKDMDIYFLFIGDGAEKTKLVAKAAELGLENVTFLPPIPKEQVPSYMSVIDVALVPLKQSETFKSVIPSKIFEAAAMRKPILLGVDGEARAIVEKYDAGLYFEPEVSASFVSAVKRMATDARLYQQFQAGCGELSIAYDRKNLADKMLKLVGTVTLNNRSA